MNLIYNDEYKSETFCLTIKQLNLKENPSNQSINGTVNIISNHLEKYLKLVCHKIRQDETILFEPADQVKINTIKIAYPIILVFGLLGNILSFIIMLKIYKRKKRGENRFLINLTALTLADLAVLTFGCFREYSDDVLEWRLRSMNLFFCKLFYFNCYLFSCFSSYLHVFISIERWYAISNPIKSKMSTVKNKRYILMIFLFCVIISLPYAFIAQIKQLVTVKETNLIDVRIANLCEIVQESYFADLLIAINDYIICCMIPFVLAFTFSSLTLFQLLKNKRMKLDIKPNNTNNLEMTSQNLNSKNNISEGLLNEHANAENIIEPCNNLESKKLKDYSIMISHQSNLQSIKSNSTSNLKLTIMLMTLPICYVITNFPIFIILILQFNNKTSNDYKLDLVIAKVFMYTNNSINILFYLFLGKNFQNVFNDLICKTFKFKYFLK